MLLNYGISGIFIRPPRASYSNRALGPRIQKLSLWNGEILHIERLDFHIRNRRKYAIECTLYTPLTEGKQGKKGCILYCHGASGGRLDGLTDAWEICMQHQLSLCTFDFSGCGLSQGETVTLGFFEEDDVRCVVKHLVNFYKYEEIVLWGRSMGAVACVRLMSHGLDIPPPPFHNVSDYSHWTNEGLLELLEDFGGHLEPFYPMSGARESIDMEVKMEPEVRRALIEEIKRLDPGRLEDPKEKQGYMAAVTSMILDSPYANLWNVSRHIIEHYKSMLPRFILRTVANTGLPMVRKSILNKIPEFDILEMDVIPYARKCKIPVVIFHGKQDSLIPWIESHRLYSAYGTLELKSEQSEPSSGHSEPRSEPSKPKTEPSEPLNSEPSSEHKGQEPRPLARRGSKYKLSNAEITSQKSHKMKVACKKIVLPEEKRPEPNLDSDITCSAGGVYRRLIMVEGDHNSLRSERYYNTVSEFLHRFLDNGLRESEDPIRVVPMELENHEINFFYGVGIISEFTEQKLVIRKSRRRLSKQEALQEGTVENSTVRDSVDPESLYSESRLNTSEAKLSSQKSEGSPTDMERQKDAGSSISEKTPVPNESSISIRASEKENSKPNKSSGSFLDQKEASGIKVRERRAGSGSGVLCSVKTVSISWRIVLGLHPRKGVLVLRPYSAGALYAIRYQELLSCQVNDNVQLEFVFLDKYKVQRRIRFYTNSASHLKEYIDKSMRRLVRNHEMSTHQITQKIAENLPYACETLVNKHLLQGRGLTTTRVRTIAESILDVISSILRERESSMKLSAKLEKLVIQAVEKAVYDRTGWKAQITKRPSWNGHATKSTKAKNLNGSGPGKRLADQCLTM
ncbi:hypothetical protein AAMO2058_000536200 [Amorphochlora amoebiformis]